MQLTGPANATVTNPAASTGAVNAPGSANISSTEFMQLLLAQLKNQDPTQPVDSTQFMNQLATLTQVEQSTTQTTALNNILSSMSLTQAEQVIGKVITSGDGALSGTAVSARIASEGVYATLQDGSEILLAPGVKISSP